MFVCVHAKHAEGLGRQPELPVGPPSPGVNGDRHSAGHRVIKLRGGRGKASIMLVCTRLVMVCSVSVFILIYIYIHLWSL